MRIRILAAIAGLALLVLSAGSSDATGNMEVAMEPFTVTCPAGPVHVAVLDSETPEGWTNTESKIPFFRVGIVEFRPDEGKWLIGCDYMVDNECTWSCWQMAEHLTTRVKAASCTMPPEIPGTSGATGRDVTCYRPAKLKTKPKPKPTPW